MSMGDVHTKWKLVKMTLCLECTKGRTIFQIFRHQCELWICAVWVYSCSHPSPPLLTGLWRERVNWHGATRRPAWRSTRWYRTGWMRSCSGSSWPRSGTGCLGSSYGSEPPRMLCGATGGLTWGRQWEGRGFILQRLSRGQKDIKYLKNWSETWTEHDCVLHMTGWG